VIPVALDVPRCEDVADRLSELLDGELDGPTAAAVVLHLARCAGCARLAADLAATIRALHGLRPPRGGGAGSLR
jgi:anti-sigma factor RsiW